MRDLGKCQLQSFAEVETNGYPAASSLRRASSFFQWEIFLTRCPVGSTQVTKAHQAHHTRRLLARGHRLHRRYASPQTAAKVLLTWQLFHTNKTKTKTKGSNGTPKGVEI